MNFFFAFSYFLHVRYTWLTQEGLTFENNYLSYEKIIIITKLSTGVRDYIHVVDLAVGHVAALKKLEENCGCKVSL